MPQILDTTGKGILDTTGGPVLDTFGYAPVPPAALLLVPPGIGFPGTFTRRWLPTQAFPEAPSQDAGTGTEAASWHLAVTGAGITQWLNPVRESVTGLDVSLHMSYALGAILQFASTGNERLIVRAQDNGVTVSVGDSGQVLGQGAEPFPPVPLTAGAVYAFGPFRTSVQVPGTSTVQVALNTTSGVQVLVVQGPDAH